MSVIIRLQGLSWSASAMDIRNFFKGLSIPPGGVRIIGGDNGDAFIAFSTDEDARQAMMLTNKPLNDSPVQLFLSSKTEMQNTISQAKDKTPSVSVPVAPAVSTNLGTTVLSQIPSVQQISQAFPAVGQIMGSLGIQQPQSMQINQFQSGFQKTVPQGNIPPSSGFLGNSNMNSQQQKIISKEKGLNQYEQELPGEYSVGGIQGLNKHSDAKSSTQRQVGFGDQSGVPYNKNQLDALNQGLSSTQDGGLGSKDNFRGEVYFPQIDSQNQPWENSYQQQNLNQNNPNMQFGNKQPFNNQPSNFPGHGKPFHGDQSNLSSLQFGHGKPFQSENSGMNNLQTFPGMRSNFPPSDRQGGLNNPLSNRPGDHTFQPRDGRYESSFQSSNHLNDNSSNRHTNINFPQRNVPTDAGYSQGSQQSHLNVPPTSQSNKQIPTNSSQADPKFLATSQSLDSNYTEENMRAKSSLPKRNRQSASRFSSATDPRDTNAPTSNQLKDSSFSQSSQPNDLFSTKSPTKPIAAKSIEIRDKTETGNYSIGKPSVPMDKIPGGLILSNKRDEFGRNLPYAGREGNLNDSSRTPTQDEKYDDSRSRDSSDLRLRDSDKRSSRDRSRDRSNRRDSPRDRDRRERDRSRRERDDDRRSRRDRDKDRDRDRKPRERDSERYEKNRDLKDRDRRTNSANDSGRRTRKRSLSPSSKNKNDHEKKLQTEEPGQSPVAKQDLNSLSKTSAGKSLSNDKREENTSASLDKDTEKKASTGPLPLFPVVPPPRSSRGLLGEAPATLRADVGNINPPQSQMNKFDAQNITMPGSNVSRVGAHGGPLLDTPVDTAPKDFLGQGRPRPRLTDTGMTPPDKPAGRHIRPAMGDQSQTFEYGHSGSTFGDRPFDNRPDYRGSYDMRDEQLNRNIPPNDYRGPEIPPFDNRQTPEMSDTSMDNQQRPRLNRGQSDRDVFPPFAERNQRDYQNPEVDVRPFEKSSGPPFHDRRPRDFRQPQQGQVSNIPPHAAFGERPTDFKGREGRHSLLGDGSAQHEFSDRQGRFHDGPAREGMQSDGRFPPDFRGPPQGQYGRPFNNSKRKEMPSLLDDISFGDRQEFQGRSGREPLLHRDGPPSDFRGEHTFDRRRDFHDGNDRNMFNPGGRNDSGFDRRGNMNQDQQRPEDFNEPGGFRGHSTDDRHFNKEQMEFRENRPPFNNRGRDFGGPPGPNMDSQNNFGLRREDDRSRLQAERDRDRHFFHREGTSFNHEMNDFDQRGRYDNRFSGRHQDRIDTTRDRSNDRDKGDRNREQHGDRSERGLSFRDDRKGDIDVRRERGDERSNSGRYSMTDKNESNMNSEKQNEKDVKQSEKNPDTMKGPALCSIVMENIPVETTYKDIRRLFSGLELPKDGIKIINDNEGKRIGKAYVRFGSQDSFKKGLQKDRTRLGNKIMIIKPVPRKEFDNAIDSYLPPDDDDDGCHDLDMCNSLSATLRALKGEPELKIQKKTAVSNTKDFVVKLTLLPEYVKMQNIKSYFEGFNIAKNGEAIVVESSRLKSCTGLCYVEFADESSFQKALNLKKMFERKTIKITQCSKKEMDDLINKMKKEINNKLTDKDTGESKDTKVNTKSESKEHNKTVSDYNRTTISEIVNTTERSKDSSTTSAETSKAPHVKTACTCVRVRKIPKTMKVFELRTLFEGIGVNVRVAQICHDAVGKAIGEGYVEFSTMSDVQKCLVKNDTYVGNSKIAVEPVTKTEMIENMRLLRQSLQPETPTTQAVFFFVKAAKLPKNVSTGEIMNFFSGYNPAPESIRLNIGDGNEPPDCSTALVGFRTREEAETAIASTNGNLLRSKSVQLTKVIL